MWSAYDWAGGDRVVAARIYRYTVENKPGKERDTAQQRINDLIGRDLTALAASTSATISATVPGYTAENKDAGTLYAGMAAAVDASGVGVVKANATDNTKNAVGLMLATTTSTVSGEVITDGPLTLSDWSDATGATLLLAHTVYYLDVTGGMLTPTPPSTVGSVVQRIGTAVSTTTMEIEVAQSILL